MPGSLVELAARPGDENGDRASDEIWRAGKDKCDSLTKAKCLHNGGEEVLETIRSQVHMGHESEDPGHGITCRLLQTFQS